MANKELFYAKSVNGELVFDNKKALVDFLSKNSDKSFIVTLQRETGMRTGNQNNALHLWFSMIAKELNDAGYPVNLVLKQTVDVEWNTNLVKDLLWRPAQRTILGKESTKDLDKVSDIDEVWETLNRFIGERFGIHVPFPDDPNN